MSPCVHKENKASDKAVVLGVDVKPGLEYFVTFPFSSPLVMVSGETIAEDEDDVRLQDTSELRQVHRDIIHAEKDTGEKLPDHDGDDIDFDDYRKIARFTLKKTIELLGNRLKCKDNPYEKSKETECYINRESSTNEWLCCHYICPLNSEPREREICEVQELCVYRITISYTNVTYVYTSDCAFICNTYGYVFICDTYGYVFICDTYGYVFICDTYGYVFICDSTKPIMWKRKEIIMAVQKIFSWLSVKKRRTKRLYSEICKTSLHLYTLKNKIYFEIYFSHPHDDDPFLVECLGQCKFDEVDHFRIETGGRKQIAGEKKMPELLKIEIETEHSTEAGIFDQPGNCTNISRQIGLLEQHVKIVETDILEQPGGVADTWEPPRIEADVSKLCVSEELEAEACTLEHPRIEADVSKLCGSEELEAEACTLEHPRIEADVSKLCGSEELEAEACTLEHPRIEADVSKLCGSEELEAEACTLEHPRIEADVSKLCGSEELEAEACTLEHPRIEADVSKLCGSEELEAEACTLEHPRIEADVSKLCGSEELEAEAMTLEHPRIEADVSKLCGSEELEAEACTLEHPRTEADGLNQSTSEFNSTEQQIIEANPSENPRTGTDVSKQCRSEANAPGQQGFEGEVCTLKHPRVEADISNLSGSDVDSSEHEELEGNILEYPRTEAETFEHPRIDAETLEHPRIEAETLEHPRLEAGTLGHTGMEAEVLKHGVNEFRMSEQQVLENEADTSKRPRIETDVSKQSGSEVNVAEGGGRSKGVSGLFHLKKRGENPSREDCYEKDSFTWQLRSGGTISEEQENRAPALLRGDAPKLSSYHYLSGQMVEYPTEIENKQIGLDASSNRDFMSHDPERFYKNLSPTPRRYNDSRKGRHPCNINVSHLSRLKGTPLPLMQFEILRLCTFAKLRHTLSCNQWATRMAQDGFYSVAGSPMVRCFSCAQEYFLKPEDEPPELIHESNCYWQQANKEMNAGFIGQGLSHKEREIFLKEYRHTWQQDKPIYQLNVKGDDQNSMENQKNSSIGIAELSGGSDGEDDSCGSDPTNNLSRQPGAAALVNGFSGDYMFGNRRRSLPDDLNALSGSVVKEESLRPAVEHHSFLTSASVKPVSLHQGEASGGDGASPAGAEAPLPRFDLSKASYPQFVSSYSRSQTYSTWNRDHPKRPEHLVQAGFFYAGYADCVRCFYCGLGLKYWRQEDIPEYQHARFRPNCVFNLMYMGQEYVDRVLQDGGAGPSASNPMAGQNTTQSTTGGQQNVQTTAGQHVSHTRQVATARPAETAAVHVQADTTSSAGVVTSLHLTERLAAEAMARGWTREQVDEAISYITTHLGRDQLSAETLEQCLAGASHRVRSTRQGAGSGIADAAMGGSASTNNSKTVDSRTLATVADHSASLNSNNRGFGASSMDAVDIVVDASEASPRAQSRQPQPSQAAMNRIRQQLMRTENQRLASRMLCHVCNENPVECVYMPCGHVVACKSCADTARTCVECGVLIGATANIYLA